MSLVLRRRRKEARPAELLAAALDVFVDKGFAAARIDDIAERAGVSKGTVFLYYESKQALFRAVVEEAVIPHITAGGAMLHEGTDDPVQQIRALILRYWDVLKDPKLGRLPKLVIAEAGNFPELAAFYFENVIVKARNLFVEVVERGIRAGIFRECDPMLMCRLAVAPLMFDSMWRHLLRQCDPHQVSVEVYVQTHLDMFIRGLLADPASSKRNEA